MPLKRCTPAAWLVALIVLAGGAGNAGAQATHVFSEIPCGVFLNLAAPAGSWTPFLPFTVQLCGGRELNVSTRCYPLRPQPSTDKAYCTGTSSFSLFSAQFRDPIVMSINPGDWDGRYQSRSTIGFDLLLDFDVPIDVFGMSTMQGNGSPVTVPDRVLLLDGPQGTGNLLAEVISQGPPPLQYHKVIRFTGYRAASAVIRSAVIYVQSNQHGVYIDGLAFGAAVGTTSVEEPGHTAFRGLEGPFPNPVSASANFLVHLGGESAARLDLVDLSGRRVRTLIDGARPAGRHQVSWDGRGDAGDRLPNGIYFARLTTTGATETKRVHLMR